MANDKSSYRSDKSRKRAKRKHSHFPNEKSILSMRGGGGYNLPNSDNVITAVKAPENFSLVENTEEMLDFFKNLETAVKHKDNPFINISNIKNISEDAILYLLSRLNHFKHTIRRYNVEGNYPDDPGCKKIFVDSGFPNYVNTKVEPRPAKEWFPIREGMKIDQELIPEILNFITRSISLETQERGRFYGAILECMQNATQHAYTTVKGKWWLIALPTRDNDRIHFTFLDNGVGVPQTIRLHKNEQIIKLQRSLRIVGLTTDDAELIIKALEGNFRSQTEQEERGSGLPEIYHLTELPQTENLLVLSNHGMIFTEKTVILLILKRLL